MWSEVASRVGTKREPGERNGKRFRRLVPMSRRPTDLSSKYKITDGIDNRKQTKNCGSDGGDLAKPLSPRHSAKYERQNHRGRSSNQKSIRRPACHGNKRQKQAGQKENERSQRKCPTVALVSRNVGRFHIVCDVALQVISLSLYFRRDRTKRLYWRPLGLSTTV